MKHEFDAQCMFLCPRNSYRFQNNCIKSGVYGVIAGKGNDFSTFPKSSVFPCILLCGGYQGPSPVVEQPGQADQSSPSNDIYLHSPIHLHGEVLNSVEGQLCLARFMLLVNRECPSVELKVMIFMEVSGLCYTACTFCRLAWDLRFL